MEQQEKRTLTDHIMTAVAVLALVIVGAEFAIIVVGGL
jgi:hypothetical protein